MKTVKLLLLLLIPAALFFASCQNELPEETFFIEENFYLENDDQYYHLSDVDYFVLELYKVSRSSTPGVPLDQKPIFQNERLEKGELLRLDGLEPGYYELSGNAWKINENFNPDTFNEETASPDEYQYILVGGVSGKSDKMYQFEGYNNKYIIVEEDNPVIVKLVFTGERWSF